MMTFLEALYGSQYAEITQNGKDGNKGRFNANIFLTLFLLISITAGLLILAYFAPMVSKGIGRSLKSIFGPVSGRGMGKILALFFGGIIYLVVTKTVGTEENFKRLIEKFSQYPEEMQKGVTKRLLIPFFVALVILILFAILINSKS